MMTSGTSVQMGPKAEPWPAAGAFMAPHWPAARGWCLIGPALATLLMGTLKWITVRPGYAAERDPAPSAVWCVTCAVRGCRSVVVRVRAVVMSPLRYRTISI